MAIHTAGRQEPRWYIDQIQVKAFKSFSGQQQFHVPSPHLVGIVGPNGCGKSTLLDAICFAAGCSTSVLRGCCNLRDGVTSAGSTQLPEVKVRIARQSSGAVSSNEKQAVEHHLLETSLTPEGTRSYKIDGKVKTGTQVKAFLKAHAIVINPTTIIQQASITSLADNNNPTTLAELVAGASGLTCWHQESAVARQEIARARRSLKDIQGNLAAVQNAASADQAAVQAGIRAAQLQQELEVMLQQLLLGLQEQQQQQQLMLHDAGKKQEDLQGVLLSSEQTAESLSAQLREVAIHHAQTLQDLDARTLADGITGSSLTSQIAAAQAELKSARLKAAEIVALQGQLHSQQQLLQQQDIKVQQLQQLVQHKQQAAAQAARSLAAVKAASNPAASLQQQQLETQKQLSVAAAAILQQQHAVSCQLQAVEQAHLQLSSVQQNLQHSHDQWQQQQKQHSASSTDARSAAAHATTAAAMQLQSVISLQQQLLRLQMDKSAAAAALSAGGAGAVLSELESRGSGCSAMPLHTCFTVKSAASDPEASAQLLTALAGIAGPAVLQVLVVPTVQQANLLLAAAAASRKSSSSSSGKLKIWPLDMLKARSQMSAQRTAQQQLGAGKVILPLDLLCYKPAHEAAMLRAFGGYVIAADDATAATLIQQHGLSCITLDGTISRKGSMSGGWAGGSGNPARLFWQKKLHYDAVAQQLGHLQQELSTAETRQQELQADRLAAEQCAAAAERVDLLQQEEQDLQPVVAKATCLLQLEQQSLHKLQQSHSSLQDRLQRCQYAMQSCSNSTKGLANQSVTQSVENQAAQLKQQLQHDAESAATMADAAAEELEEAQDKAEELSTSLETLQLQLSTFPEIQQHQQVLQQHEQQLQQLLHRKAQEQEAAAAVQSRLQDLQLQQQQLDRRLLEAQKLQQNAQKQLQAAAAQTAATAAHIKQTQKELKQSIKDFAQTEAVQAYHRSSSCGSDGMQPQLPGAAIVSGTAADDRETDLRKLSKKAWHVQVQLSQLAVQDMPQAQQDQLAARLAQVQHFKREMELLAASADMLEQHIQQQAEQVYAANDAVYEDIAVGFSQLCSSLLPSLELRLDRTGTLAHEGLQFSFRPAQDGKDDTVTDAAQTAGSKGQDQDEQQPGRCCSDIHQVLDQQWLSSLGMLSGGQRTLVSLAMLLAVAQAGNGSSLFLMDELDAALDEHNQARAAALLKQLAHADDGGGCQILCVTHNSAFQQMCDALLRLEHDPVAGSRPAAAESMWDSSVPKSAAGVLGSSKRTATSKKDHNPAGKAAAGCSRGKKSRSAKRVHFA